MWTTTHLGHWMPLSWMSYGVDFLLWGMEPRGYHLTNVLLHAASAALLVVLVARLLQLAAPGRSEGGTDRGSERGSGHGPGRRTDLAIAAGIGALSFAIHPLRVESVAWVTERRDVLSGLFALTSAWCYLRSATDSTAPRRHYLLALALFACGLLSKATVLTLPALLLLLEWYPLRRIGGANGSLAADARRLLTRLAPFAAFSMASALVSVRALGPVEQLALLGKVAVSAYSLVFYLWKTIAPAGLAPLYLMPEVVDPFAARYVLALIAVVAITTGAIAGWQRWPGVTVAWLAFVAALFPMLGVRQNGLQIAADRYTYHAAPVLAVLVGAMVLWALPRWRSAVLAISAVVTVALAAATSRQAGHWRDSESLWRRTIATGNGGAVARNNHGNALVGRGLLREAEAEFRQAIALRPDYPEAHMDLGVALSQQGRDAEAEAALRRALELRPSLDDAMVNLGLVLSRRGEHDEAIALYTEALRLDPADVAAEVNWGNALVRQQRPEEAIRRYERALALDPAHPQARANLEVARRMLASRPAAPPR
jgi:tetratricopeptide (TPR) repeat protein